MISGLCKGIRGLISIFSIICLTATLATADEFQWIVTPGEGVGNPEAGIINYIRTNYDTETNSFRWYMNIQKKGDVLPNFITLAVNNGPNPRNHPGELALLYLDATDLNNPILTAYGYNGKSSLSSYRDGDGVTPGDQAPDRINSTLLDTTWINELSVKTEADGSLTFTIDIDATGIKNHIPLYPNPDQPWYGIGFDNGYEQSCKVGVWMHTFSDVVATYENGYLDEVIHKGCYHGWFDTNNRSCERVYEPACEDPITITFDEEGREEGEKIKLQYEQYMIISAENFTQGQPDTAILFNSSSPTGEDDDLGTPNELFGGPGIGYGPGAGFENFTALGNLLIIAEDEIDLDGDGLVDDPDDAANGGCLEFTFDEPTEVNGFKIVDVEDNFSVTVHGFDENDVRLFSQDRIGVGDNSVRTITVEPTTVARLTICYETSAGIDDLEICQCNPDECGVCGGDNSTCLDCAGIPNGGNEIDQCGICGGDGTSCLDCAGVIDGSGIMHEGICCRSGIIDRCGVCDGDGSSCLECESIDITDTQTNIDSNSELQARVVKKLGRKLLKYTGDDSLKKFVVKKREEANAIHMDIWNLAWSIPSIQTSCQNFEFCIQSDNSVVIEEFGTKSARLNKLAKRIARKASKLLDGLPKDMRRLIKRANKYHAENLEYAAGIPELNSYCTLQVR